MLSPRSENYQQATAADVISDALAAIVEEIPEIRDYFTVLPRWDDAPRSGPVCAITAEEGEGVQDENGFVFAPSVDFRVSIAAALGEEMQAAEFHKARTALLRLAWQNEIVRMKLLAHIYGANIAVSMSPAEETSEDGDYVASLVGTVQFSNQPEIKGE